MSVSDNRRIVNNTLALYVRQIITVIISLYTSRVVLSALGVDNYGIYNLVGGVVVLFTILTSSMNGAIARFIAYEIGRGKEGRMLLDFIFVHDYLKDYLEENKLFGEYKNDYYRSLACAMDTVCSNIDRENRAEAIALSKQHLCPDLIRATETSSRNTRLFLSLLSGNPFASWELRFRGLIYKILH